MINSIVNSLFSIFYKNCLSEKKPESYYKKFIDKASDVFLKIAGNKFDIDSMKNNMNCLIVVLEEFFKKETKDLIFFNALIIFRVYLRNKKNLWINTNYKKKVEQFIKTIDKVIESCHKKLSINLNAWCAKNIVNDVFAFKKRADTIDVGFEDPKRKVGMHVKCPKKRTVKAYLACYDENEEMTRSQISLIISENINPYTNLVQADAESQYHCNYGNLGLHQTLNEGQEDKPSISASQKLREQFKEKSYKYEDYKKLPGNIKKLYDNCQLTEKDKKRLTIFNKTFDIEIIGGRYVIIYATMEPKDRGTLICYRTYSPQLEKFAEKFNSQVKKPERLLSLAMQGSSDYVLHISLCYKRREINKELLSLLNTYCQNMNLSAMYKQWQVHYQKELFQSSKAANKSSSSRSSCIICKC